MLLGKLLWALCPLPLIWRHKRPRLRRRVPDLLPHELHRLRLLLHFRYASEDAAEVWRLRCLFPRVKSAQSHWAEVEELRCGIL